MPPPNVGFEPKSDDVCGLVAAAAFVPKIEPVLVAELLKRLPAAAVFVDWLFGFGVENRLLVPVDDDAAPPAWLPADENIFDVLLPADGDGLPPSPLMKEEPKGSEFVTTPLCCCCCCCPTAGLAPNKFDFGLVNELNRPDVGAGAFLPKNPVDG